MNARGLGAVIAVIAAFAGCAKVVRPDDVRLERIVLSPTFELSKLDESTWIHTTYKELPEVGLFPSNGLMVRGDGGVVLVDTPWTPEATKTLVEWVESRLALPITDVVVTHSHDDRTGGVKELPATAQVHALALTSTLAAKDGREFEAAVIPTVPTQLTFAGVTFETRYPGAGHAPDNLVVLVPERRVLVGGCFVRAAATEELGFLADADLASWKVALTAVDGWVRATEAELIEGDAQLGKERRPLLVLPGHGAVGGVGLIAHTLELVDEELPPAK